MQKYKIIFRSDGATKGKDALTWEHGCPIEISAIQIARDTETAATFLQMKVQNISDEPVSSVTIDIAIATTNGESIQKQIKYLDADIAPASEKALKPQRLDWSEIVSCSAAVYCAKSPNGDWYSEQSPTPIPTREQLKLSSNAAEQRARTLHVNKDDATVSGKVQQNNGWWVCACGQANVARKRCCSCGMDIDLLLNTEDESSLLNDYNNYAKQKEKTKHLRKRGVIIAGAVAVIAIASVAVINLAVIPEMRYSEAISLAEQGQYDEAIEQLSALNGIEKAQPAIIDTLKKKALADFDRGDYDSAYETIKDLRSRGSDEETAAKDAGKQIADTAYSSNLFEESARWYRFIGDGDGYRRAIYQYAISNYNHDDQNTYGYLNQLKKIDYEDSSELFDKLYGWAFDFATSGERDPSASADSTTFPLDKTGRTAIYLHGRATNGPLSGSKSLVVHVNAVLQEDSFSYQMGYQTYEKDEHMSISASGQWESKTIIENTANMKTVSLTIEDWDTKETLFERTLTCQE